MFESAGQNQQYMTSQNMNMDQLRALQALGMGNPFRAEKNMPGRFKDAFTNIFEQPKDKLILALTGYWIPI